MDNLDINKDNKVSGWEIFPYWFDKLRLFPRAFITMYIYLVWRVVEWFMVLPEPNIAQAGLVSVVVGAGAAWFGLYVNSGSNSSDKIIVSTSSSPNQSSSSYNGPGYGQPDPQPYRPVIMPDTDNRG